jgi:hypothetical protein
VKCDPLKTPTGMARRRWVVFSDIVHPHWLWQDIWAITLIEYKYQSSFCLFKYKRWINTFDNNSTMKFATSGLTLLSLVSLSIAAPSPSVDPRDIIPGRYIVTLGEGVSTQSCTYLLPIIILLSWLILFFSPYSDERHGVCLPKKGFQLHYHACLRH